MLHGVADSRALSASLVFKGGNALDFIWEPNRSTKDLDFSATPEELQMQDLKRLLEESLHRVGTITSVAFRVQHMERRPPGPDKTFAAYLSNIGYALPDEYKNRERIQRGEGVSTVVPIDVSLNEPICATAPIDIEGTHSLQVCTLEDIVAEKLRALLQQIPRKRWRCQDVLDIAVILTRQHKLDSAQVASYLVRKARARNIEVSKKAFRDEEVRSRASVNYADLEATTRRKFIPFDAAYSMLVGFVDGLQIPE